ESLERSQGGVQAAPHEIDVRGSVCALERGTRSVKDGHQSAPLVGDAANVRRFGVGAEHRTRIASPRRADLLRKNAAVRTIEELNEGWHPARQPGPGEL